MYISVSVIQKVPPSSFSVYVKTEQKESTHVC
jgi:hypothetical protein